MLKFLESHGAGFETAILRSWVKRQGDYLREFALYTLRIFKWRNEWNLRFQRFWKAILPFGVPELHFTHNEYNLCYVRYKDEGMCLNRLQDSMLN